jgi:tungstate transport system substrate-binding protein
MKLTLACFTLFLMVLIATSAFPEQEKSTEAYGNGRNAFSLATGSPGELGLVKALTEAFAGRNDISLRWVKAGSGESLDMLKKKTVDMIMVHAPVAEKKAVAEGWAAQRTLIGSNEFFIVGPADDPAGIAGAKSATDAYARIAARGAKFFSRGDNSGTHKKEMEIWKKAGITPAGDWYIVTRDFMKATLQRTNAEQGYFMTDSSTWVAERNNVPKLKILFRGDRFVVNTYHALRLPDGTTPGTQWAARFIDFVASPEGQRIIREFGMSKYGEGLYNDAAYARQYDER